MSADELIAHDFRIQMRLAGVQHRPRKKRFRRRGRCQRCGVRASPRAKMTVDHIVPRCLLRDHPSVMNHFANKQTLCEDCNGEKGDGPAYDYRDNPTLHRQLLHLLSKNGISVAVHQGQKV